MLSRLTTFVRGSAAAAMVVTGAVLVVLALFAAGRIPQQAHSDFDRLVVAHGSLAHTPNYPDVYRQMSATTRMLQNAYVGGSGLVLLLAGAFGLAVQRRP